MKTDVFIWHGDTDIWLDGAWRKATPAFNVELCERFGLHPLEFDGVADFDTRYGGWLKDQPPADACLADVAREAGTQPGS